MQAGQLRAEEFLPEVSKEVSVPAIPVAGDEVENKKATQRGIKSKNNKPPTPQKPVGEAEANNFLGISESNISQDNQEKLIAQGDDTPPEYKRNRKKQDDLGL